MQANDNQSYSYQKPAPNKLAERALITLERTQKLDLLIHLLTNLQQSLVICGPHGIGKTTLLQALQNARADRWHFCHLSGSSALSFESILQQLSRSLNVFGSSIQLDVNALRASCEQQKVVLIIDDAGDLVPGLIGELASFAESLSSLRLVLAMTHDEYHIKSNIDKVLEECHVIELPPLNRKQCLDYLQNLSAHPDMPLSFNGINDTLVDDLYRETHGIPGRILAELPKLTHYQSRKQKKWLFFGGLITVLLGVGFAISAWYDGQNPAIAESAALAVTAQPQPTATPLTATATPEPSPLPIVVPVVSTLPQATSTPLPAPTVVAVPATSAPTPTVKPTVTPQPTRAPTKAATATPAPIRAAIATVAPSPIPEVAVATIQPSPLVAATTVAAARATPMPTTEPQSAVPVTPSPAGEVVKPESKPEEQMVVDKKPAAAAGSDKSAVSDEQWIMAQPGNNFTLQVMTLSSKDSVRRFMKKYAEYGESLKYYSVQKGDQEKFILIYGSFESIAEAKRYKEIMPGDFKQALEKRFRIVQKESHR